jgi:hypothetical protein
VIYHVHPEPKLAALDTSKKGVKQNKYFSDFKEGNLALCKVARGDILNYIISQ